MRATNLFVSHDLSTVETRSGRCLWLEQGRLIADDDTREVVDRYLEAFVD